MCADGNKPDQKADSFASVVAVTDLPLFRRAETKPLHLVLRATTVAETYTAGDLRASEWLFMLPEQKAGSATFLKESKSLQSV